MRLCAAILLFLVLMFSPAAGGADRAPALRQVTAPHSYYWREIYVPQLTSGPSSLAWSRRGERLYFSMQGRIWRQRLDAEEAEQITAGAGYDYQPDVSPDGRSLVFARREGDAINLVALDLKTGRETAITHGDGVNVDPRWAPDGARIAYVTTVGSGNFHIAIAEKAGGEWTSQRWRPATTTADARYYYAPVDHELSPAWSPDGAELAFVSNADVVHGTGKIVRQRINRDAPPQIIRDEETNWKARPDWSPDGRRIAYSSYLGRQWHQLWMTTAEAGGYPMPFTYGDFDVTSARWSPDGARIAYISNRGGDVGIEIIDVVGGARRALKQTSLKRRVAVGAIRLAIRDATGAVVAARVQIRASDGRDYAPTGALIHADDHRDPSKGVETHYFHSDGDDRIETPPGRAEIRVWRGLSSAPVAATVTVAARAETVAEMRLDAIDGAFANWKSGDAHVHMNYGGAYRIDGAGLARQADAEALDLVFNLIVNKEQRIPDIGEFSTTPVRPEKARAIIAQAQEFHTSVWGHLGLLGLQDHLLMPDYVGYPKTAVASLYPDNATIARLARDQGALVGYVHPFDPPAPDPSAEGRLSYALPADVALGLVDYLEVVGFSDHRITEAVWHRLLNCGFRLPAAGGTDAMTNYASLRGPVGLDRTYVDIGAAPPSDPSAFTRAWLDGLKAGRSFATNSALIDLTVEGQGPGADLQLGKRGGKLKFKATMASIAAISSLEVIVNGAVVATVPLSADGKSASAEGEIEIDRSSWISLRASGDGPSADVFDLYPYAVASPIFVTVGGRPQRSPADAAFFIAWIDRLIAFTRASDAFNSESEREEALANFTKARREFERRR